MLFVASSVRWLPTGDMWCCSTCQTVIIISQYYSKANDFLSYCIIYGVATFCLEILFDKKVFKKNGIFADNYFDLYWHYTLVYY